MVVMAAVVAGACSTDDGRGSPRQCIALCPQGPVRVMEVFANSRSGNGLTVDDPSGQTPDLEQIDGADLTYGLIANVGGCANGQSCPTVNGEPLTCDATKHVCVNAAGRQPGVHDAIIDDTGGGVPIIEIVFNMLLQGDTVEQFGCACADPAAPNCPNGKRYTVDYQCRDCPDNPDTPTNEAGACFDLNGDGVYDIAELLPNIVTVTCGAFVWSNAEGDGYYDPSGNQIVGSVFGFRGLGPSFHLTPSAPFPSDVDCELKLSGGIIGQNEESLELPAYPITWHTESR
jgi:hypothetical protein